MDGVKLPKAGVKPQVLGWMGLNCPHWDGAGMERAGSVSEPQVWSGQPCPVECVGRWPPARGDRRHSWAQREGERERSAASRPFVNCLLTAVHPHSFTASQLHTLTASHSHTFTAAPLQSCTITVAPLSKSQQRSREGNEHLVQISTVDGKCCQALHSC